MIDPEPFELQRRRPASASCLVVDALVWLCCAGFAAAVAFSYLSVRF
jgi:hypothetical protein